MDNKVVIFELNKTRIAHTDDITPYSGRADVLINPEIPPGIPPHAWHLVDGKISTLPTEEVKRREEILELGPLLPLHEPVFMWHKYLLPCLSVSILSSLLTWFLLTHV